MKKVWKFIDVFFIRFAMRGMRGYNIILELIRKLGKKTKLKKTKVGETLGKS